MKIFFGQDVAGQDVEEQAVAVEEQAVGTISSINRFILFYSMNIY